ncbi:MAG: hypothetical protein CL666_09880 [Balneola sp.]|nr:hypothetical protein [Balneola sp.]|tara:strand:- start:31530 stop:32363 length:834 start_codon:yes stop_codon:yes gene_type:complete
MDLFFNEISKAESEDRIHEILQNLYICFRNAKKIGFKHIRIDRNFKETMLANDYSLLDFASDPNANKTYQSILLSSFKRPYLIDDWEEEVEEFLSYGFYFENRQYSIDRTECAGLASAYIKSSISISLHSINLWLNSTQEIIVSESGDERTENVLNICNSDSIENDEIREFIYKIGRYHITESKINSEDKPITISGDHHGKKEMKNFASKLVQSKYVTGVRSIEMGGKRFIHSIEENGSIKIVIPKTDLELKLLVETTGTDVFETKKIADILEQEFS